MRALVVMAILAAASPATAADYSVNVPAGWTEAPPEAFAKDLESVRKTTGVQHVAGTIYISPNEDAQMTLMHTRMTVFGDTDRGNIEMFDKGLVKGAAGNAVRHISDSREFVAGRLHGDSIDEAAGGMQMVGSRIIGVDKDELVHLLSASCLGTAGSDSLAACVTAQKSMTLYIPNEVAIGSSSGKHDLPYLLGKIVGGLAVAAFLVWLIRRNS